MLFTTCTDESEITHTPSVDSKSYGLLQSMGYKSRVIQSPKTVNYCENTTIRYYCTNRASLDMKCVIMCQKICMLRNYLKKVSLIVKKYYEKLYASKVVSNFCRFESLGFNQARLLAKSVNNPF